ncbi:ABC transporter permease subunit [Paenibacillus thermotolerans]|uniref:ABC transporter permease subunit n=1 Tax=Paenibacillus thermotolerans TaxID=3027807 RepID=UPI0023684CEE|nr:MULTISPECIES: ABC transporter permease subunit [unclassified Paenibacillus]
MKLNLIKHEMLQNRRGWFIGALVIVGFLALLSSFADLYIDNEEMTKVIESFPPALLEGFGIDPSAFGSFEGFLSGQPYTFFVLLLGVFGAIWASTAIAKERDRETDEFLFSLPYSRASIYLSKAFAHWLQVTAIYIVSAAVVVAIGFTATEMSDPAAVLLILTGGYLISLAFSGIGFAVTVLLRTERDAMTAGIGLVIVSFLLNMLAGMDESIRWLSGLSLFQAYDSGAVISDGALTWGGTATTVMIYIIGLIIGLILLKRQDI